MLFYPVTHSTDYYYAAYFYPFVSCFFSSCMCLHEIEAFYGVWPDHVQDFWRIRQQEKNLLFLFYEEVLKVKSHE